MRGGGLQFLETGQPRGFTTLATSAWDGKPEPIVRELLQNALDAARASERERAEVVFTVASAPIAGLPGIGEYRSHFEAAAAERERGAQGREERDAIARIRAVLGGGNAAVLFCRDNGQGLDGDRLRRVLGEGDSGKPEEGAGSKGLGHLTAFAASDLRYVLYAGRSRGPDGALRDAASGHAILASRRSEGGNGTGVGGDGFLLRYGQRGLFDDSDAMFPERVPALLAGELEALGGTGSVVAVLGFNGFRGEAGDDPAEAIREAAATHFLAAIALGEMTVRVRADDRETAVERGTLAGILERHKGQTTRHGGVLLPGAQAWRAWRVFGSASARDLGCGLGGVRIRFRSLDGEPVRDSRVQLYRDGMWITNDAPGLAPGDFGGSRPFDAVVMLTRGELYDLVRDAEGPEHRGLDRNRLVVGRDASRWLRLRGLLRAVAARLREEAGERDEASAFVPPDFAMFSGETMRAAEPVRRYRPRPAPGRPDGSTTPAPDDEGAQGEDKPGGPRGGRRGVTPRPGRGVPVRASVAPRRGEDGEYRTLRVAWRLREGEDAGLAGVRLRVPSGSDETCEQPLAPRWLPMRSVAREGRVVAQAPGDGGAAELVVPLAGGELEIALAEPISDPNAIELDVVRRRTADGDD